MGTFRVERCALPLHMLGYHVVPGTVRAAPCGVGLQDKPVEAEPFASDDGKLMMLDEGIPAAPHGVVVPRS